MYELPRIISAKGRTIQIANLEATDIKTYLTAAVAATGTALTVADNAGFTNSDVSGYIDLLLIGELGSEKTEITSVNAAVVAGTSITSTATVYAHPINCPVRKVLFNQWKIYGNATATTVGGTLIDTVNMQVDSEYTEYVNNGTEYAYYYVLAYDSVNASDSDVYSDFLAADTVYASGTVGGLMRLALKGAKQEFNSTITYDFLLDEINECLRFISGKLKHWSSLQNFDYGLGLAARGTYSYTLPTDIEDKNTNKSILGVRVGSGENLIYKDKREWEHELNEVKLTTVRTQAIATDTTLAIDNSYDFSDSGSVDVYVSGTKYTLTYTGVTRSATAGVLTGIPATGTGSITVTIPADTKVWQSESEGIPTYYTVYDGSLYIWPLADGSYDNNNIWLDYYTQKTSVSSDEDTIEFPRYDAVKHWLIWKIRSQNNSSGQLDTNDGDFGMFNQILNDMIRREVSGQKFKQIPKVNKITY